MQTSISIASFDEIKLLIEWARLEGWNPGIRDAYHFQLADPNGFLIAKSGDEPIGGISLINYSDHFSFLGLYIVRPEFRGLGHGMRLWKQALAYAGSRNCGLDSVVAQQVNYKKSGFQFSYRNIRYALTQSLKNEKTGQHLVAASSLPMQLILDYDRSHFPSDRSNWIMAWVLGHNTIVYFDQTAVRGYGVVRPCSDGYKIGPLFADTFDIARSIFIHLCHSVDESSTVFLDIPEVNSDAIKLVNEFGMQAMFETARMYNVQTPKTDLNSVFGVTTFELG